MRNSLTAISAIAMCSALAACGGGSGGGGGGGVVSTPTPKKLSELNSSASFDATSASNSFSIELNDASVVDAAASRQAMTISYDKASDSYTLTRGTQTETFSPAEQLESRFEGEVNYEKGAQSLSLSTTAWGTEKTYDYVGKGLWIDYGVVGSNQINDLSTFVYGYESPASAVPVSGQGQYWIDMLGSVSEPGEQAWWITGQNSFLVDFTRGAFTINGSQSIEGIFEGISSAGSLYAAGKISDGGFSGTALSRYGGFDYTGDISGSFYGPDAQEIGGQFTGTSASGGAVAISFTGVEGDELETMSLAERFGFVNIPATTAQISLDTRYTGEEDLDIRMGASANVVFDADGLYEVRSGIDEYVIADIPSVEDERENFDSYELARSTGTRVLSAYRIEDANSEIQLSYSTFFETNGVVDQSYQTLDRRQYILAGLNTHEKMIEARTGGASYSGILYGNARSLAGADYELSGSSSFGVDFGNGTVEGGLAVMGNVGGADEYNFGLWTFAGDIAGQGLDRVQLSGGGLNADSQISTYFFGPYAQEIGATFIGTMNGPEGDPDQLKFAGVALAKED